MLRNPYFAGWFVTVYLAVYAVLTRINSTVDIAFCMMLFGPVLLLWLAFTVVKFGKYDGAEFGEQDEFGYQDKDKSKLGMF